MQTLSIHQQHTVSECGQHVSSPACPITWPTSGNKLFRLLLLLYIIIRFSASWLGKDFLSPARYIGILQRSQGAETFKLADYSLVEKAAF